MYKGQFFTLNTLGDNQAVELVFNAEKDPVNTLRNAALTELEACITLLEQDKPKGSSFVLARNYSVQVPM